ncbi:MAG: DUF4097 domain-containing protein [Actinomycetia bacterium]|nr:DUF4097 domain-containing protein [Actinomycetes bacterium]MCP4959767.1 DUF4097 domain-containing protein [Actinomycetes bacterium]
MGNHGEHEAVVRIVAGSHRVKVVAGEQTEVAIEGKARVSRDGTTTTVDHAESRLVVKVPEGADIVIGVNSGRIETVGRLGSVALVANSGRVTVDKARTVDIRVKSGAVVVGAVEHECRIRSNTGRIEVGRCGSAQVSTNSGRIQLSEVSGSVKANCVSGRISIAQIEAADIDAETVSGRIEIKQPPGTRAHRSAEMDSPLDLPADCDCVVRARSVSGRVDVK